MRRVARAVFATLITIACVIWTIYAFDWRQIDACVARMRWGFFATFGLSLVISAFALRGLRWMIVLGLPIDRWRLWQSFCANGAASGLASLTPLQLGEMLKTWMIPEHDDRGWQQGMASFFLERVMDLAGVAGIGLCGLSLHFGQAWLAALALLSPAWAAQLLYFFNPFLRFLPVKVLADGKLARQHKRITIASLITVLLWLLYAALWWAAISAMNVSMNFDGICLLLGGVMLTVAVSMTPGGLGVAELGSQGILLWLGRSRQDAEAAAIAVRFLTPLFALSGGGCMLLLLLTNRHVRNFRWVAAAPPRPDQPGKL